MEEEKIAQLSLDAEFATKTWEDALSIEVQERVARLLTPHPTKFQDSTIPGIESPGQLLEDIVEIEYKAIEQKVSTLEEKWPRLASNDLACVLTPRAAGRIRLHTLSTTSA